MILTNDERETIITFDETPCDAIIFTYNKAWQRRLEQKLGIKPTFNNGYGGREYHIPKKRIPMPRVPRKLSPEQGEKLANRLRQARHQKSSNSLGNNATIRKSRREKVSEGKEIARQKKGAK